jgi:hypothetical protein
MDPVASNAQVKSLPVVMAAAFRDKVTALGVAVDVVERLWPICPLLFLPKHETEPFDSTTHVCAPPVAIDCPVPPSEAVAAGITTFDCCVSPRRPSW